MLLEASQAEMNQLKKLIQNKFPEMAEYDEKGMNHLNEAAKIFIKDLVTKMINVAFSYKTSVKMRQEMEDEIQTAISPILKKYGYVLESDDHTVKTFEEYTNLSEAYRYRPDYDSAGYKFADDLIYDLRKEYRKWSDEELDEFKRAMLDHFSIEIPDYLQK